MTGLPADARVFLGRLTRLDPDALVRLRPGAAGWTGLWARVPWEVLVTRDVRYEVTEDVTVGAADLLTGAGWPARRDEQWRWPLPRHAGTVVEEIPAPQLRAVAAAAAGTLREVSATGLEGRPVGVRVLREALLDHVPIVVEAGGARFDVPQRLVQAVLQMGFLGTGEDGAGDAAYAGTDPVRVRRAGRWVGLAARYGTAWLPPPAISLTPTR